MLNFFGDTLLFMKGLPVIGFGVVMLLSTLWFLRIFRHDRSSSGYRDLPVEYWIPAIVVLYPVAACALWLILYIPFNLLAQLPEWNLGLTGSITWNLALSVVNLIFAWSLIAIFHRNMIFRMRAPFYLSIILLLGGIIYSLILVFQDTDFRVPSDTINPFQSLEFFPQWMKRVIHAFANLSKVSIVAVFILLKSYLGPLATGYILCSLLYSRFVSESQVDVSIFVLGPLLDWALEAVPYVVSSLYLVLQVSYNVIVNGFESLNDYK